MVKVNPFKENVDTNYDKINTYTKCPLRDKHEYESSNKYDGVNGNNIILACLEFDSGKLERYFLYCLCCENLFFTIKDFNEKTNNFIHYFYVISEFEYEYKVIIGTPIFDSFFNISKEIHEKKLNSLTFTCCNINEDNILIKKYILHKYTYRS